MQMYKMHTYCLSQSTEAYPVVSLDQSSPQTQSMDCRSQQSPVSADFPHQLRLARPIEQMSKCSIIKF